ncbi:hypothetical protein J8F10_30240 [Gemmata sp. G18]|uniref:Type II secretion system protein E n=1 Tax=Gemmata palustris TaxID=2822762 RepID=A0ABS5C0N1_9BACT|nr:hypothetical protein [Gemmata palustris]MBP3959545.1 hypothetical protein [Gemmata palustris]
MSKLEDRLDMSSSKRMPQSLLRQSLRQHAEQITDQEARGFAKADRDRLIEEALAELMGFGPLEELFADPGVREVMVTGPGTVIARREHGQWLPTSVKFRDEGHVRATLDRIAAHAEPVGPVMTSITLFDMRLPNGFRAIAVIPPDALDQPATASFLRDSAPSIPMASKDTSGAFPGLPATGSTSHGTLKTISGPTPGSRSGSGITAIPAQRVPSEPPASGISDPLARHRVRILERLLSKFAALKVYDVTRLEVTELRKVISAYIREYGETEKVYLSETDQGRIMLEILTSLQR